MTKRKKIGIITFSNTLDNYGQVLQYLATQEYLLQRGHEVFLFQSLGHKVSFHKKAKRKIKKILKKILHIPNSQNTEVESVPSKNDVVLEQEQLKRHMFQRWAEITQRYENEHPRHFEEFRMKYFHILKCYYEDVDNFYAFAVGSDQMWSFLSENTMLDFVPNGVKRFSIAPSVGHKIFTHDEISRATDSICKFDFITVREQSGIDFCHACGRKDAKIILDPTFLLDKKDYERYADLQGLQLPKRYILLYLLGGEIEATVQEIFVWAKQKKMEVIYVASQGREDEFPKCFATVEQWLAILKNAEYVFTNSFHGMALSIIFHKLFLTFPLVGLMSGMNGRVFQLAENFQLQERIYDGNMNIVEKPIRWIATDTAIQENMCTMNYFFKTIDL